MSPANIGAAGYFDAEFVDRLVQKCARLPSTGFRDNLAFVGILSTQVWHETFINGAAGNRGIALASPKTGALQQSGATAPQVNPQSSL